jgi:hypothetical protein
MSSASAWYIYKTLIPPNYPKKILDDNYIKFPKNNNIVDNFEFTSHIQFPIIDIKFAYSNQMSKFEQFQCNIFNIKL